MSFIAANKVYTSTNKTTIYFIFLPGWMRLSEGADRVAGQLRRDKECPFSGVTKSGRVWRKVPESDARSVWVYVCVCVCVCVRACVCNTDQYISGVFSVGYEKLSGISIYNYTSGISNSRHHIPAYSNSHPKPVNLGDLVIIKEICNVHWLAWVKCASIVYQCFVNFISVYSQEGDNITHISV